MEYVTDTGRSLESTGFYNYGSLFREGPFEAENVSIFRIGDVYLKNGERSQKKVLLHEELLLNIMGNQLHCVNGREMVLSRHNALLLRKGSIHEVRSAESGTSRFVYIEFEPKPNNTNVAVTELSKDGYLLTSHAGEIENQLKTIFSEITSPHVNSDVMVDCHMQIIYLLVYRLQVESHSISMAKHTSEKQGIAQEVKLYLNNNYLNLRSLSQIGDALGYSYSYISHIFSECTGMSISAYYNDLRFQYAAECLLNDEMTNEALAFTLNYRSEQAFSKAFKAYYGVSPQTYYNRSHPA